MNDDIAKQLVEVIDGVYSSTSDLADTIGALVDVQSDREAIRRDAWVRFAAAALPHAGSRTEICEAANIGLAEFDARWLQPDPRDAEILDLRRQVADLQSELAAARGRGER